MAAWMAIGTAPMSIEMVSFRLLALVFAVLVAGPAAAHQRELELSRQHEHPFFAGVGGASFYDPDSSPEGSLLQLTAAIRYVKPHERDATYDFSGTQLSVSRTFADTEHHVTVELDFRNFLPRTELFTFDHHFFYGAGIGTAFVSRDAGEELALPVGTLIAGLQSRVRHFDVESSVKLVIGPYRHAYDVSGTVVQVAFVYPLEF